MGAWGTGIYDNDMALDFKLILIEEAFKKAELNEDFLVVADIIKKENYLPTIYQSAKLAKVINDELSNLDCWKENKREDRKHILLDLLQKSTFVYISKDKKQIIYPCNTDGKECKVQMHFDVGGVLCEWFDLKFLNENYDIVLDNKFKIGEHGLECFEVEHYFKNL